MSYDVLVLPSARGDLHELYRHDRELARAALANAEQLRENPWLGREMRSRVGLVELEACRRVAFDREDWAKKPRYRLVYRNEPSDGAVHIVAILAAARRKELEAYRRAKPRLIERLREQRGD